MSKETKCPNCAETLKVPNYAWLNTDTYGQSRMVATECCGAAVVISPIRSYSVEKYAGPAKKDDWGKPIMTTPEFIAHDWAGWNDNIERFTHVPSGNTMVCQSHWGQSEWYEALVQWFKKYDGSLTIHDCPGAYNTDGRLMGTIDELCGRLEKHLRKWPALNESEKC